MPATTSEFDYRAAKDERLLLRFRQFRDERAFAELVHRYETMVLGVAQQMLGCGHAAEDVFQATFLVLARDAKRIRNRQAIASWLYGVAYRIAARLSRQRAKQAVALKDDPMVNSDPLRTMSDRAERQAVHDELHELPDRVRTPMVLRYLQGKSNAEVADELNLSESAVEGRLKRGRNQLRIRLARQGVGFVAAIAILETMKTPAIATQPTLVSDTVAACLAGSTSQAGLISDNVTQLANQEMMKMMTTSFTKASLVSCLAVGALTIGWAAVPTWSGALADQAAQRQGEVRLANTPPLAQERPTEIRIAQRQRQRSQPGDRQSSADTSASYDLKSRTPVEQRMLAALQEKTRFEFNDTPLSDVLAFISELHGLQVLVDEQALEDENISVDQAMTMEVKDIRLRSALDLLLRPLHLEAVIRDEVMLITSQSEAEELLETHVYRVDGIQSADDLAALINVIVSAVAPDSWDDVGGPGSISAYGGGLVVSQSQRVHEELNELLQQLSRLGSR